MEKVLITGIAAGQGRLLALRLRDSYDVCGADSDGWEGAPRGIQFHRVDLRKKKFEDVIRTEMPTAIVHLGTVRHFRSGEGTRPDGNVRGTLQLFDHCINHGVQKLVVVSTGDVYGAFPENPYYMDEDSPLAASRAYPAIRDLVEMDTLASAFLWRYPHVRTCVVRPVNTLGPTVHSTIAQYFRQRRIPTVMGFDPMLQFIHEEDVSEAIALALEHGLQGVFNVVGPGAVPLHTAIREIRGRALSVPEPILRSIFARLSDLGVIPFPPGVIDYLKFPITLSGERFVEATNFRPRFGLEETFESLGR